MYYKSADQKSWLEMKFSDTVMVSTEYVLNTQHEHMVTTLSWVINVSYVTTL